MYFFKLHTNISKSPEVWIQFEGRKPFEIMLEIVNIALINVNFCEKDITQKRKYLDQF